MTALSVLPAELALVMQRRLDAATVEGALGVRVLDAGGGRVRLEMPLPPSFADGSRAGGALLESALAVLCDCGLGLALMERRGDGDGGITLDLRLDSVVEVLPDTRRLVLVAEGVHVGEQYGVGRAEVRDEAGRLIAYASGTMALNQSLPIIDRAPLGSDREALDLATVFDGLEVVGGVARVPIGPEAENTRGIVHGALLAAAALNISRAAGERGRLLSLSVEFLRPVPADVGNLEATITPVRTGRRFLSDRISLSVPGGRVACTVTGVFARE